MKYLSTADRLRQFGGLKKKRGIMSALVLFAIVACLAAVRVRPAGPRIETPLTEIIINEKLSGGRTLTKELRIPVRNTGREVLKIRQVKASCGCTKLSAPPEILPNQSGAILATVNIPPGFLGEKVVTVLIESNAPDPRPAQINLILHIGQAIAVSEEGIEFGTIALAEKRERTVWVEFDRPNDADDPLIIRTDSNLAWRPLKVHRFLRDGEKRERREALIEVVEPGENGPHRQKIEFALKNRADASETIQCLWTTVPPAKLVPPMLILNGESGEEVECAVVLREGHQIQDIVYDKSLLTVQQRDETGRRILTVKARGEGRERRLETVVTIVATGGYKSELPVRLLDK